MAQPPAGTVTFLFTDIEGSTRLWQQHPDGMDAALKRHHALLNTSIAGHGGYVFQIIGDAFCAAFTTANDGLEAALQAQHLLSTEKWDTTDPIRVRMALHTGKAEIQPGAFTSGEYASGLTLSRTSRLLSAGHGGQILLSLATSELVRDHLPADITLHDLGARRLKDLVRPEHIFQVVAPGLPSDFAPLKTLDVHPHNLPVQLTSFIGREKEMAEIKLLLTTTHLLTLTGIGGTGKTRLALQVAADLIDEFPSGVWLVNLAPVPDPALVEQTVAVDLTMREQPGQPLGEQLVDYLRDRHLLLILDNCEHLVKACARLADLLLSHAPQLKILATSRTHLNLAGETTYHVQPLALPDQRKAITVPALAQYEAVRLFIDRASTAQPAFKVNNANAPAVAQICTHLDGIPLAIELAAARVRHLSPKQISDRLGDRFSLLTGGSRAALPRQQTLRAAIDWSYDLLNETERTFFTRLAVFAGSFSLEAVEAICTDELVSNTQVLDLLCRLVDYSLVNSLAWQEDTRYTMLETVWQYALEKLTAAGELRQVQDRHLDYYREMALEAWPQIYIWNPDWWAIYEIEYDNLRLAIEHAIATDLEAAIQVGCTFGMWVQFSSQRSQELLDWAMRIHKLTESWPPGSLRRWAIWMTGDIASLFPDRLQQAHDLLETSVKLGREYGDKKLVTYALQSLSCMYIFIDPNWEQALRYSEQYQVAATELGDKHYICWAIGNIGIAKFRFGDRQGGMRDMEQAMAIERQDDNVNFAVGLQIYAEFAQLEGDPRKASQLYEECVEAFKPMTIPNWKTMSLYRWGQAELQLGNAAHARELFDELLAISLEYKYEQGLYNYLAGIAGVTAVLGEDERAATLFGVICFPDFQMTEVSHKVFDPLIAQVRDRLGVTEFDRIAAVGNKLTLEQALELAKQLPKQDEGGLPVVKR